MYELASVLGADMTLVPITNLDITNKQILKTMEILNKQKVSVEEMKKYYASQFPYFDANNQRVGRFAKQIGYHLTKQMRNRKYTYFYLKNEPNNIEHEQNAI